MGRILARADLPHIKIVVAAAVAMWQTFMVQPPLGIDMEGDSTEREYTEAELRAAGASALFVAYYKVADAGASARREVEQGPFSLEELNENPSLGGGFFNALWSGDEVQALRRADGHNSTILEEVTGKTREDTFRHA